MSVLDDDRWAKRWLESKGGLTKRMWVKTLNEIEVIKTNLPEACYIEIMRFLKKRYDETGA